MSDRDDLMRQAATRERRVRRRAVRVGAMYLLLAGMPGAIELRHASNAARQLVTETGIDTGRFVADVVVPPDAGTLTASYGYLGFRKIAAMSIE
jgi:hypothetical protein